MWIEKKPIPHRCGLPAPAECEGLGTGSIWRCEDCGSKWKTTSDDGWNWTSAGRPRPLKVDPVQHDYPERKDRVPFWKWS